MRGLFYQALGFLVWKGFVADLRRRARIAAKRAGIAALLAVAVSALILLTQRPGDNGH
ncbi:MAG TPA: hypothetical protein VKB03_01075 [Conexibacter sp.]|nr:hypothetical protein [Conexibacter sp.]